MVELDIENIIQTPIIRSNFGLNPAGTQVALSVDNKGSYDALIVYTNGTKPSRKLNSKRKVVIWGDWHPTDGSLALNINMKLWIAYPDGDWYKFSKITKGFDILPGFKWSADGTTLVFVKGSKLCFYDHATRNIRKISPELPGISNLDLFKISPNGDKLLVGFRKDPKKLLFSSLVVVDKHGKSIWIAPEPNPHVIREAEWINNNCFYYRLNDNNIQLKCDFFTHDLISQEHKHIFHEETKDVETVCRGALSPTEKCMLISSEKDGWCHWYLYDFDQATLEQLTIGQCEDCYTFEDRPVWSPDGTKFIFSSNRENINEMQLYMYDLKTHTDLNISHLPGTSFNPIWAKTGDSIVFTHAEATRCEEIYKLSFTDGQQPIRITGVFSDELQTKLRKPTPITFKSKDGLEIHAFLHSPIDIDPHKRYPALVYCHGGPAGQLKGIWEDACPNSFGGFYGWNQYLASKGYYVIEVNMRGSTGRGQRFRAANFHYHGLGDVEDCANAGRYLQGLSTVDPGRIGIYGVSFGGFMTFHNICRHPEIFSLGISNAGLWDIDLWNQFLIDHYGTNEASIIFNCGMSKEIHPELWKTASPSSYKDQLRKPIVALQGLKDDSIGREHVDDLKAYCEKTGKTCEVYIYPTDGHVWNQQKVWRDAYQKYEQVLDKYLGQTGGTE